jgi:hypothetical protein
VMEKQNPSSQVLASLLVRDALGRRRQKPSQTVTLSERDVARVLQAVYVVWEKLGEFGDCIDGSSSSDYRWNRTPEGWPVPSRRLMEEIKKLL